jgi:hypothetical protein
MALSTLLALSLLPAALCYPPYTPTNTNGGSTLANSTLNNLTSPYTLTAYIPWDCAFNGLKANNLNLFQATVAQYCPEINDSTAFCPNGTDTVFVGTLYPVSFCFPFLFLHLA